eukprot:SAG31_NODE_10057_length_1190_cov_1.384968_2_plen_105_part_00
MKLCRGSLQAANSNFRDVSPLSAALSRIKIPHEDVLKALIACDPFALGAADEEAASEMILLLESMAPEQEELDAIDKYLENPGKDFPGFAEGEPSVSQAYQVAF